MFAVFFPFVFISGIAGILFNQLGFLVTVMILVSLLAALTLIPMLASKLLPAKKTRKPISNPILIKVDSALGKVLDSIDNFYKKVLEWALDHKKSVVFISLLIFISSLALIPLLGTEFIPNPIHRNFKLLLNLNREEG
jgi:multidrug efflux pump subunit AcrB